MVRKRRQEFGRWHAWRREILSRWGLLQLALVCRAGHAATAVSMAALPSPVAQPFGTCHFNWVVVLDSSSVDAVFHQGMSEVKCKASFAVHCVWVLD